MPSADADDLRQEAEHVRAESSLVQANTELVKAKAALAAAGKPRDVATVADAAQKKQLAHPRETADVGEAYAGDRKAADLANVPGALGRIGRSGIEGSIQVRSDAANGEATLLSSYALTVAANRIAADLAAMNGLERVLLAPCGDHLQFGNYRQFLLQTDLLRQIFHDTARHVEVVFETGQVPKPPPPEQLPPAAAKEVMPELALATSVVAKAADLGSYFLSNYEIGGIAVAPADVEQLISALAGSLVRKGIGVVLVGRRAPQRSELACLLGDLPRLIMETEASISDLASRIKRTKQAAEQTPDLAAKIELQETTARLEQAAARCRLALTRAGDFIAGLAAADARGALLITKVAQEKAVCNELTGKSALMLVVQVHATVGGYYTRKNLWTLFGTMPFSAMGGAVVTYQLLDKDGALRASGLIPIHSGYRSIPEVEELVNSKLPTDP
jgi:hypothetical protein